MAKVRYWTFGNCTADHGVAVYIPAGVFPGAVDQHVAAGNDQSWAAADTETVLYPVFLSRSGHGLGNDPDHHHHAVLPGVNTHWSNS